MKYGWCVYVRIVFVVENYGDEDGDGEDDWNIKLRDCTPPINSFWDLENYEVSILLKF